MAAHKKFKVAICGGGIGGLTAAIALSQYPHIDVEIYEACTEFSEVGAGIGVWPRVWRILDKLGLSESMAKITALKPTYDESDSFIFRKSDQAEGLNFYKLVTQGSFLRYHRPDVLEVLVKHLPSRFPVNYSMRLSSYKQDPSGRIDLYFANGEAATCDVLIGADGIKSAVRRSMLIESSDNLRDMGKFQEAQDLLEKIEPRWTGIVAYRALVPTERLRQWKEDHPEMKVRIPEHNSIPTMYMGQHINVVVYPISSGKLINVGAFHARDELAGTQFPGPWVTYVDNQELVDAHAGWEDELQAIIQCIDKPSRWAVHMSKPLNSWVSGNVCLLGDAAHAMSPQQASGAGQAIEDAYLLSTLLGHHLTTLSNTRQVLAIYDAIRRPIATEVAERSLINGRLFGLQLPGLDVASHCEDIGRLPEIGDAIRDNWKWTWTTTVERSVERAVAMLEAHSGVRAVL